MKKSVHDNGGFIGRVADYTATDYYTVFQASAYEVANASYTNVSLATGHTKPVGVMFSSDGTKVYFQNATETKFATLSTPSDLSTASSLTTVSSGATSLQSITFNPTGTKVYYVKYHGEVYFADLSTAWDLTTKGSNTTISSGIVGIRDLHFNNDGTKLYLIKSGSIYSYPLATAYTITSTDVLSSNRTAQSITGGDQQGFRFNSDGTKLFAIHGNGYSSSLLEYSLSTAYDITTIGSATTHTTTASQVSDAHDFTFSHDGTKFYVVGLNNSNVYEYKSLTTSAVTGNKKNTGVWSMDADYLNAELLAPSTPTIFSTAKVHVDADDTNSYSGTGTTWSDLSGNNYNFTLTSAGLYNSTGVKHMAFQNSNDRAEYSSVPISQTNGVTYVVATRPKLPTNTSWRTLTRGASADHHVLIESGSYDIGFYNNSAGGFRDSGADQDALPSHTNNDWILMYFRWANGEGYKFSYNDTPSTIRGTLASDTYAQYDNGGFKALGNNIVSGQPWGDIALFAAWETELTDAELTTIYNAYRSRFSLP